MDGFINLLKPAGMTSHDAVYALRRILSIRKVGHTGTLDPMAAGVLSMCVGSATRAAEYIESEKKRYRCEMVLGLSTDTGDIWGKIESTSSGMAGRSVEKIPPEMVKEAVLSMTGPQSQLPPMYSAVRKNGRHLYEYARNGESVEIEPRDIFIYDIRPVSVFHRPGRVIFDVECSKGTYIRTLCTDIGEKLGCGAAMSFLVRTASGNLDIRDSVRLENLAARVAGQLGISVSQLMAEKRKEIPELDLTGCMVPIEERLSHFGLVRPGDMELKKYMNGGRLSPAGLIKEKENSLGEGSKFNSCYCVCSRDGRFAGTAVYDSENDSYKADKVFFKW